MYMAFPLHGGLVELCHTAAENTHPAFGLFTGQRKSSILLSAPLLSHLYSTVVMVLFHFSYKKEEKNI